MPTYQYACTECGENLEAVQKFSDDPLTVCPACGGKLRKVFSAVGIVFKGSGFYRNDSRVSSANGSKALNGSSGDSSSSGSSSEKSAGTEQKTSSNSSSSGESKPGKTSSGSEKSSSTGAKVA